MVVAITGGICSGKSTVCKYIEDLGYAIYYSDNIAKELANSNHYLIDEIKKEFGDESYISGKYNTKYIGEIVFSDKSKLNRLNEIFKPYLDYSFKSFRESNYESDIIFFESAIVFENNLVNRFDKIVCVYADKDDVIERLKKRNNLNDDEIKIRLDSQIDPLIKMDKSDYIINTSIDKLEIVVDNIIMNILSVISNKSLI